MHKHMVGRLIAAEELVTASSRVSSHVSSHY